MGKKFFITLLVSVLLVNAFTGCSANTENDESSPGNEEIDTESTPETGEETLPEETEPETTEKTEKETDPETTEETEEETDSETAEETEPEAELEYTLVWELNFTGQEDSEEIPFSLNNIIDCRIEDGLLKGTSDGSDPYMRYVGEDFTGFSADSVQEIHIKIKNYSESFNGQFFFTTETVSWSEGASYRFYHYYNAWDEEDNEWNEIQLQTDTCSEWAGNITGFRLDPFDTTGDFEIESIQFYSVTEK